jgi:CysZ protein
VGPARHGGTIPNGTLARLNAGAALPGRGFEYLLRHPRLWRYAAVPAVLAVAGVVAVLAFGLTAAGALLAHFWTQPEAAGWHALLFALWWVARLAIWLVLLVLAALALPSTLGAPAMDRLSARVEAQELGASEAAGLGRALAETWRALANALPRLIVFALGHAALLLLVLLPVVNVAYPVLAFLWTARWTAVEYLDLPMSRNLHRLAEVRATLRRVQPVGLGFGGVLALLLLVPLANLLVVPVATVAGTLLYCDLVRAGLVPRASAARPPPVAAASSR